jgi:hypothetical protein
MGEYEDTVAALRDEGLDELADKFDRFSNQEMRKRIGKTAELERELEQIRRERDTLKAAPKRAEALKAAGVDVSKLRPAERELIESSRLDEGKEYDETWAKGLVEKYQLPVAEGSGEGEGTPPAGEIARQATETPGAGSASKTTLKAKDVASWGSQRRMEFREWCDKNGKNDVWEALLRGQDVTGVTYPG